ncbi:MAG: AAA family ATPase, partial [Bacteroidetes bacterium]
SIAFIVDYAETLLPMTDSSSYRPDEHMLLVFMQKWAKEKKFLDADLTVVVLTENIAEINQQYIRNPYTHDVNISYPVEADRLSFINHFFREQEGSREFFEMKPEILAKNTAGLGLVHLDIIMSEATRNKLPFTNEELTRKKKEMIENEAGGLLEFVETRYSLTDVAGHAQAKKHLLDAARALKNGRPDVMPMGYLVSGPVGTGKTFMIRCFASDIGVPMVMLKNFRGMYVGQSEGNLQKVLKILKAMAPVAVMIDEADAYLGNRRNEGGSGVNSRIFSMLATFMSDTDNRGRIIWFLVTARPDLMPVDFKRQGRAEEHIALFYPESLEEKRELLQVMLKKTGLNYIEMDDFDEEFFEDIPVRSGADMEAALTRSKFKAASLGLDEVNPDIIAQAFNDFLPPTYPEEIELMEYAAVLECTSKELLPPRFRDMPRQEVLEKVEELQMRIR